MLVVGRHSIQIEPPDVLRLKLSGDISERDMRGLTDYVHCMTAHLPYTLVLADVSELGDVPASARRVSADLRRPVPYRGMAFVKASFQTRILMKLVLGAMNQLTRTADNPLAFFDTEEEARAWLRQRRHSQQICATL